ncbi:transporter substrate-binding domain-containing protein [Pseudomonas nitroreducens]|uniref:substrate-binding periplasmic protein n=1 Tax=Pseudomonas nitroreducens TaxID=46680 RepID=UPI001475B086|nr:transporter substrate-binding domain-containing protein [Pseudomonas nitroreducens]MDG9858015.1 transporter substrate-binding domain-containing protein [Pseudomonas nitroreducens]MDH1077127.1 transporter substrate-binding domain-containing protein [Pseudomonas nitroreducens]NMZ73299.1 amino acid ABC transporter substrate-binding protein [Pseudomonas nitroreducens]
MKLKAFCWALASILSPVISAPVVAQTYVVGVENLPFAPHYSTDAQGNYQGFARDVLDLFASSSGISLEYRPLPVDALLPALLSGEVDLKYPDNPDWAPEQKAGKTLRYSQPVTQYVDGVLVAPERLGQGIGALKRLALVEGWTPRGYEAPIQAGQISLAPSADLRQMVHTALKRQADGAYFNVVVATYYLDNIRAKPGALVFDPSLPHTRSAFHLSTVRQGDLIQRFDRFLVDHAKEVAALKAKFGVEASLDSEHLGVEQWKVDFLERQKAKQKSP